MNINDSIDKYFYPQIEILKNFHVPKRLCIYDVLDFRDHFWIISNGALKLFKEIGNFTGHLSRVIDKDELFECGNIRAILVIDPFSNKRKVFMFVNELKRLTIKDGEYSPIYTRICC